MVESVWIVERKLKVDDPVGAFSVHGVNGIWGILSIGLLADGQYGRGWNGTDLGDKGVTGILYGGTGWGQLAAQAAGAVTIIVVMGGIALAFFKIQNKVMKGGIRVDEATELAGVDEEMGVPAYADFVLSSASYTSSDESRAGEGARDGSLGQPEPEEHVSRLGGATHPTRLGLLPPDAHAGSGSGPCSSSTKMVWVLRTCGTSCSSPRTTSRRCCTSGARTSITMSKAPLVMAR